MFRRELAEYQQEQKELELAAKAEEAEKEKTEIQEEKENKENVQRTGTALFIQYVLYGPVRDTAHFVYSVLGIHSLAIASRARQF